MTDNDVTHQMTYDLTEADFRKFNTYVVLHGTPYRWARVIFRYVFILALLSFVVWVNTTVAPAYRSTFSLIYMPVVIIAMIYQAYAEWIAPMTRARRTPGTLGTRTFTVRPDYAEIVTPHRTMKVRWSSYLRVVDTPDFVALFTSTNSATVIPVRAFGTLQVAQNAAKWFESYRVQSKAIDDAQFAPPTADTWPPAPKPTRVPLSAPDPQPDPARSLTIAYEMTAADSRWAHFAPLFWRTVGPSILIFVILIVANASRPGGMALVLSRYGPIYLIYLGAIMFRRYTIAHKALVVASKASFTHTDLRTDYNILQVVTPTSALSTQVSSLSKIRETTRSVLVFTDPANKLVIPKRAFASPGDAKAFVDRMKAGIAS